VWISEFIVPHDTKKGLLVHCRVSVWAVGSKFQVMVIPSLEAVPLLPEISMPFA
jgi:hypothetical protein